MIPQKINQIISLAGKDGFDLSAESAGKILSFLNTLKEWNGRINLMGPSAWGRIWEDHIVDSLWIDSKVGDATRIADFGSGAGFPGVILAALREDRQVHLIEGRGKKCRFLRVAAEEAGLHNITVINRAVEPRNEWPDELYKTIVTRAAANPEKLMGLLKNMICDGGRLMALIGTSVTQKSIDEAIGKENSEWSLEALDYAEFYGKRRGIVTLRKVP